MFPAKHGVCSRFSSQNLFRIPESRCLKNTMNVSKPVVRWKERHISNHSAAAQARAPRVHAVLARQPPSGTELSLPELSQLQPGKYYFILHNVKKERIKFSFLPLAPLNSA